MKKILTLCMVCKEDSILLGMKKRGFGEGHWNGFGGKVEENETIETAAIRELKEEAGIEPLSMSKVGILDFSFQDNPKILEVHIFKITNFSGEPTESEEMMPRWFKNQDIPFDKMWPDDIYWIPIMLQNKTFRGGFLFDSPSSPTHIAKIIEKDLLEVQSLV